MNNSDFGKYTPHAWQGSVIRCSNKLKTYNWLNRKLISCFFRLAGAHRVGSAFDWQIFGTQQVRLYPGDNLCEKRVLMSPVFWDAIERDILRQALCEAPTDRPFIFVDAGANVGLYSLYVNSIALAQQKAVCIIAIEPAPATLERLNFNIAASHADAVRILPWALTENREEAMLFLNNGNRGESSLSGEGEHIVVEGHPLSEVFTLCESDHIDAVKIDIEGAELPAVRGMFTHAPVTMWPELIIIEGLCGGRNSKAIELIIRNGYQIEVVTHMNTILRKM